MLVTLSQNKESERSSDEELMLAYQQGQEEAFMLLYKRHSGRVYGYLSARIQDRAVADDAFQGTFLKLHSSRAQYDPKQPFLPWLFVICKTAMLDTIRNRTRVNALEKGDELALQLAAAPVPRESVDLPNLDALPPGQRQAIELRYLENLSFDEMASRLNSTPENMRQLVSRALRRLKSLVKEGKK